MDGVRVDAAQWKRYRPLRHRSDAAAIESHGAAGRRWWMVAIRFLSRWQTNAGGKQHLCESERDLPPRSRVRIQADAHAEGRADCVYERAVRARRQRHLLSQRRGLGIL